MSQPQEAVDAYTEAAVALQDIDDDYSAAVLTANLGAMLGDLGEYELALSLGKSAFQISGVLGDRDWTAFALQTVVAALTHLGRDNEVVEMSAFSPSATAWRMTGPTTPRRGPTPQ